MQARTSGVIDDDAVDLVRDVFERVDDPLEMLEDLAAHGESHRARGVVAEALEGALETSAMKFVGMAFQAPTLLPWRTTLDNVLLPLEIVEPYRGSFRRKRDEYVERALALLRTVGLDGYADKYPWQLSGGMQQRASICRALIHEPKMLLLD